jgi:hypothetical protein
LKAKLQAVFWRIKKAEIFYKFFFSDTGTDFVEEQQQQQDDLIVI